MLPDELFILFIYSIYITKYKIWILGLHEVEVDQHDIIFKPLESTIYLNVNEWVERFSLFIYHKLNQAKSALFALRGILQHDQLSEWI